MAVKKDSDTILSALNESVVNQADGAFFKKFEKENFISLTGKEKVNSADDVAFIFRVLKDVNVENAFAVLVKDKIPTVIHIATGDINHASFNIRDILLPADRLEADEIYFVHNHPGGNVEPSEKDKNTISGFREAAANAFGDRKVPVHAVIVDGYKNIYSVMMDGEGFDGIEENPERTESGKEKQIDIYKGHPEVFNEDYEISGKIMTPFDTANLVNSMRLGKKNSICALVMSGGKAVGNLCLPFHDASGHEKEIARLVAQASSQLCGTETIIFGNSNLIWHAEEIQKEIAKITNRGLVLLDVMHISDTGYISAVEHGAIEQQKETLLEVAEISEPEDVKDTDDIDVEEYIFKPVSLPNGVIDYTGIEHDKIYLANRKDILTKPRPDWIPDLNEGGLRDIQWLPHCMRAEDGSYYVSAPQKSVQAYPDGTTPPNIQKQIETFEREMGMSLKEYCKKYNHEYVTIIPKTVYKMSLDVLTATVDYYMKREKEKFTEQTRIIFNHYNELNGKLQGKRIDLNLQKQDYIDTHRKGEETSYGDKNLDASLLDEFGVMVKKQNGTAITDGEKQKIRADLEKVSAFYGGMKKSAEGYGLKISYADDVNQHARKAVGLFTPAYNAIGVSYFKNPVGRENSGMIMAHETAHWLDSMKGRETHYFFASDRARTPENKIAEEFKRLFRKYESRNGDTNPLGKYWNRTCECFARAEEEAFAIENGLEAALENDRAYLPKDVFMKEIMPLVKELNELNREHFRLEGSPAIKNELEEMAAASVSPEHEKKEREVSDMNEKKYPGLSDEEAKRYEELSEKEWSSLGMEERTQMRELEKTIRNSTPFTKIGSGGGVVSSVDEALNVAKDIAEKYGTGEEGADKLFDFMAHNIKGGSDEPLYNEVHKALGLGEHENSYSRALKKAIGKGSAKDDELTRQENMAADFADEIDDRINEETGKPQDGIQEYMSDQTLIQCIKIAVEKINEDNGKDEFKKYAKILEERWEKMPPDEIKAQISENFNTNQMEHLFAFRRTSSERNIPSQYFSHSWVEEHPKGIMDFMRDEITTRKSVSGKLSSPKTLEELKSGLQKLTDEELEWYLEKNKNEQSVNHDLEEAGFKIEEKIPERFDAVMEEAARRDTARKEKDEKNKADTERLMELYADEKKIRKAVENIELSDFVSFDKGRTFLQGIYREGGYTVATDGKMLAAIRKDYPAEQEKKIIGVNKEFKDMEINGLYPNWKKIDVEEKPEWNRTAEIGSIDELIKRCTVAAAIGEKDSENKNLKGHNVAVRVGKTWVLADRLLPVLCFAKKCNLTENYQEPSGDILHDENGNLMRDENGKYVKKYNEEKDRDGILKFSDGRNYVAIATANINEMGLFFDENGVLRNYEKDANVLKALMGTGREYALNFAKTALRPFETVSESAWNKLTESNFNISYDYIEDKKNDGKFPSTKAEKEMFAAYETIAKGLFYSLSKKGLSLADNKHAEEDFIKPFVADLESSPFMKKIYKEPEEILFYTETNSPWAKNKIERFCESYIEARKRDGVLVDDIKPKLGRAVFRESGFEQESLMLNESSAILTYGNANELPQRMMDVHCYKDNDNLAKKLKMRKLYKANAIIENEVKAYGFILDEQGKVIKFRLNDGLVKDREYTDIGEISDEMEEKYPGIKNAAMRAEKVTDAMIKSERIRENNPDMSTYEINEMLLKEYSEPGKTLAEEKTAEKPTVENAESTFGIHRKNGENEKVIGELIEGGYVTKESLKKISRLKISSGLLDHSEYTRAELLKKSLDAVKELSAAEDRSGAFLRAFVENDVIEMYPMTKLENVRKADFDHLVDEICAEKIERKEIVKGTKEAMPLIKLAEENNVEGVKEYLKYNRSYLEPHDIYSIADFSKNSDTVRAIKDAAREKMREFCGNEYKLRELLDLTPKELEQKLKPMRRNVLSEDDVISGKTFGENTSQYYIPDASDEDIISNGETLSITFSTDKRGVYDRVIGIRSTFSVKRERGKDNSIVLESTKHKEELLRQEGKPYVRLEFSEAGKEFDNYHSGQEQVYDVKEFNDRLMELDRKYFGKHEGYYKTEFTLCNIPNTAEAVSDNGIVRTGKVECYENPVTTPTIDFATDRYDIGDGNGSMFGFIKKYIQDNPDAIKSLEDLEDKLYFPDVSINDRLRIKKLAESVDTDRIAEARNEFAKAYIENRDKQKGQWMVDVNEVAPYEKAVADAEEKLKTAYERYTRDLSELMSNINGHKFSGLPEQHKAYILETLGRQTALLFQPETTDYAGVENDSDYWTLWRKDRWEISQIPVELDMREFWEKKINETEKEMAIEAEKNKAAESPDAKNILEEFKNKSPAEIALEKALVFGSGSESHLERKVRAQEMWRRIDAAWKNSDTEEIKSVTGLINGLYASKNKTRREDYDPQSAGSVFAEWLRLETPISAMEYEFADRSGTIIYSGKDVAVSYNTNEKLQPERYGINQHFTKYPWEMIAEKIISLIEKEMYITPVEEKKAAAISVAEETRKGDISEKIEILKNPPAENARERVYKFFREEHTAEEKAEFIKSAYGLGFRETDYYIETHDMHGITVSTKHTEPVITWISWNDAAEITDELIRKGEYLTKEEIAVLEEKEPGLRVSDLSTAKETLKELRRKLLTGELAANGHTLAKDEYMGIKWKKIEQSIQALAERIPTNADELRALDTPFRNEAVTRIKDDLEGMTDAITARIDTYISRAESHGLEVTADLLAMRSFLVGTNLAKMAEKEINGEASRRKEIIDRIEKINYGYTRAQAEQEYEDEILLHGMTNAMAYFENKYNAFKNEDSSPELQDAKMTLWCFADTVRRDEWQKNSGTLQNDKFLATKLEKLEKSLRALADAMPGEPLADSFNKDYALDREVAAGIAKNITSLTGDAVNRIRDYDSFCRSRNVKTTDTFERLVKYSTEKMSEANKIIENMAKEFREEIEQGGNTMEKTFENGINSVAEFNEYTGLTYTEEEFDKRFGPSDWKNIDFTSEKEMLQIMLSNAICETILDNVEMSASAEAVDMTVSFADDLAGKIRSGFEPHSFKEAVEMVVVAAEEYDKEYPYVDESKFPGERIGKPLTGEEAAVVEKLAEATKMDSWLAIDGDNYPYDVENECYIDAKEILADFKDGVEADINLNFKDLSQDEKQTWLSLISRLQEESSNENMIDMVSKNIQLAAWEKDGTRRIYVNKATGNKEDKIYLAKKNDGKWGVYYPKGANISKTAKSFVEKGIITAAIEKQIPSAAEMTFDRLFEKATGAKEEQKKQKEQGDDLKDIRFKSDEIEIRGNYSKQGFEVKFFGEEDKAVVEKLTALGFKYSKKQEMYYIKNSDEAREFIDRLVTEKEVEQSQKYTHTIEERYLDMSQKNMNLAEENKNLKQQNEELQAKLKEANGFAFSHFNRVFGTEIRDAGELKIVASELVNMNPAKYKGAIEEQAKFVAKKELMGYCLSNMGKDKLSTGEKKMIGEYVDGLFEKGIEGAGDYRAITENLAAKLSESKPEIPSAVIKENSADHKITVYKNIGVENDPAAIGKFIEYLNFEAAKKNDSTNLYSASIISNDAAKKIINALATSGVIIEIKEDVQKSGLRTLEMTASGAGVMSAVSKDAVENVPELLTVANLVCSQNDSLFSDVYKNIGYVQKAYESGRSFDEVRIESAVENIEKVLPFCKEDAALSKRLEDMSFSLSSTGQNIANSLKTGFAIRIPSSQEKELERILNADLSELVSEKNVDVATIREKIFVYSHEQKKQEQSANWTKNSDGVQVAKHGFNMDAAMKEISDSKGQQKKEIPLQKKISVGVGREL